jgi:hypothetical protein
MGGTHSRKKKKSKKEKAWQEACEEEFEAFSPGWKSAIARFNGAACPARSSVRAEGWEEEEEEKERVKYREKISMIPQFTVNTLNGESVTGEPPSCIGCNTFARELFPLPSGDTYAKIASPKTAKTFELDNRTFLEFLKWVEENDSDERTFTFCN